MNTARGKNRGTYSSSRRHDSNNAANAVGLDGRRSTNVTAIMMPHTTSITRPTLEKKRLIRKRVKIFGFNLISVIST